MTDDAAHTARSASLAGQGATGGLRFVGNKKDAPMPSPARSGPHVFQAGKDRNLPGDGNKNGAPPRAGAQQTERQVPALALGGETDRPAKERPIGCGGNDDVPQWLRHGIATLPPEAREQWVRWWQRGA